MAQIRAIKLVKFVACNIHRRRSFCSLTTANLFFYDCNSSIATVQTENPPLFLQRYLNNCKCGDAGSLPILRTKIQHFGE